MVAQRNVRKGSGDADDVLDPPDVRAASGGIAVRDRSAGGSDHRRLRNEAIARRTPLPLRRMAPGMSSTRPTLSLDRDPDVRPSSPWSGGFDGVAVGSADLRFDPLMSLLRRSVRPTVASSTRRRARAERYTRGGYNPEIPLRRGRCLSVGKRLLNDADARFAADGGAGAEIRTRTPLWGHGV